MRSSLGKIQYTELKLSCGNDPVVKISIYSNGDIDLWPNHPKIHRVLSLLQGDHVAKFGKDPIYRTKVIVRKSVWTPARPPARHTQSHNMARLQTDVYKLWLIQMEPWYKMNETTCNIKCNETTCNIKCNETTCSIKCNE